MDLAWLQANWMIVAVAGGGALLVLLILIVSLSGSGKKRKLATTKVGAATAGPGRPASRVAARSAAKPTPAAPAAKPASASPAPSAAAVSMSSPPVPAPVASAPKANFVLNLASTKPEDWQTPSGEQASAAPSPSGLRLAAATAAVSVASAPARPGDQFVCDYEARLVATPPNGGPVNFFVGPVMRDVSGNLINYYLEQTPFTPDQTVRTGSIEVTAPDGSTTVHVGVHGSWRADGKHGDAAVEFTQLRLRQK